MGKNKKNQDSHDKTDVFNESFYKKMAQSFAKAVDRELTFNDRHSSIEGEKTDRTKLLEKELELKERELQLLRREQHLANKSSGSQIESCSKEDTTSDVRPATEVAEDDSNDGSADDNSTTKYERRNCQGQHTFLFRDVEESLSKFSGEDEYKIEKWISDVEEAAICLGWNDVQKMIYGKKLLEKSAKESLKIAVDTSSWIKLITFLKKEFSKLENSAIIHKKMRERKKDSKESYRSYLISMRQIGTSGGLEDDAIIQYCIDGIADFEMNKSILYGATTMDDFKKKLELYGEMKTKIGNKDVEKHKNNRDKKQYKKGHCFSCGERGHNGKDCTVKEKGPKCFRCNEFGHIAPKCPKPKTERKPDQNSLQKDSVYATQSIHETLSNIMKSFLLNGCEVVGLIDCGSDLNLITNKLYCKLGAPKLENIQKLFDGVGSSRNTTQGTFCAKVNIDNEIYDTVFHVVPDTMMKHGIILGKEIINQTITVITTDSVIMKKAFPDNCFLCIENEGDLSINTSHITNPLIAAEIRNRVSNYRPLKKSLGTNVEMRIVLSEDSPIYQKPRRLSPLELGVVRKKVDE